MLHCSNGLIWYSARCWLLFWYARQSVLMEDDCSRVWRQFDGLWMRAHSVPLTAQDNALCSLLPLSHNLTKTQHTALDSVTQHQDLQHCSSVTTIQDYSSLPSLIFCSARQKKRSGSKTVTVCFQKLLFLEMNRSGLFFLLFVCGNGNSGTVSVCRGIVRVERGPHLGCSAQSSQSLWVF